MAVQSFTHEAPVSDLDPMWLDVAKGAGGSDWMRSLPTTVHAATLGQVPAGAKDVGFSVSLKGDETIVFTACARAG